MDKILKVLLIIDRCLSVGMLAFGLFTIPLWYLLMDAIVQYEDIFSTWTALGTIVYFTALQLITLISGICMTIKSFQIPLKGGEDGST